MKIREGLFCIGGVLFGCGAGGGHCTDDFVSVLSLMLAGGALVVFGMYLSDRASGVR